ncbi:MAG TPA: primosomal protein N' [Vicinamibacterales bacterium]|nr:primosomal protein N' [Vicinamibacterales bacterium]
MALVSVAVPVPFLDLLTYHVPDDMTPPARGARVSVPLGKRVVTGVVVGPAPDAARAGKAGEYDTKDLIAVLDDEAFIPPAVVDLAMWVAEYYACGPGDALAAAMPPAKVHKTVGMVRLPSTTLGAGNGATTRKQAEVLELLRAAPAGLSISALNEKGISTDVLKRMAARDLVAIDRDRVERDPFRSGVVRSAVPVSAGRVLTNEQAGALESLCAAANTKTFAVSLLQGVTGSGKTEVYLRLAARVLEQGRTVLVLVPEIALTPAVASAFREAFGDQVAVQHSGLSDGERYDQWHRIRRGEVSIVVGTRSAVFAPLTHLGLIIVDEEHDTSFKQEETPRYHGRDVAVMRGKQEAALVVLGSATPSLESGQNAATGRYERVLMRRRVHDRALATVEIVDMRQEYAAAGPDVILSERLKNAISVRLAAGQQSLVLLNRRGLATAVFCRQCGGTLDCPNCSVSLILHTEGKNRHRARCHYCNHSVTVPKACPACAGPYLERRGFGTERVAAEISALWPDARVARLDRDSVRRRGAAADILRSMASGAVDVLVGTQMIAKGHDFPRVTLVGVISADVGLGVADFRAAERTFQLLTQVAGRAGRGADPGEAIVQTLYPKHYSILHACRQDYESFFAEELRYREAMKYPPHNALVNVVVRAPDARSALADAATLATHLRGRAHAGRFLVLGPAPAPVAKLRGEYRAQVFLKGSHRGAMREAVQAALAAEVKLQRRVAIDIDPVSIL